MYNIKNAINKQTWLYSDLPWQLHFKKTSVSKTPFDMCALRADMIMSLWDKILSTGAELAGTQNMRENSGCRRGKSSASLSRREDSATGSNASLYFTTSGRQSARKKEKRKLN